MAIQKINLGAYPNDGTGDDLRTAFKKVNDNFQELNTEINVASATNLGTNIAGSAGLYKNKNGTSLQFKSLACNDNSVEFISADNNIFVHAKTTLLTDLDPHLGNNLNLSGHYIHNGDAQTTVHGLDVKLLNSIIAIALETNQLNIDLGTIASPTGVNVIAGTGYELNFGRILTPAGNMYDFGIII